MYDSGVFVFMVPHAGSRPFDKLLIIEMFIIFQIYGRIFEDTFLKAGIQLCLYFNDSFEELSFAMFVVWCAYAYAFTHTIVYIQDLPPQGHLIMVIEP